MIDDWDPSKGFVIYDGRMIPSAPGFGATVDTDDGQTVYAGYELGWIPRKEFEHKFPKIPLPL